MPQIFSFLEVPRYSAFLLSWLCIDHARIAEPSYFRWSTDHILKFRLQSIEHLIFYIFRIPAIMILCCLLNLLVAFALMKIITLLSQECWLWSLFCWTPRIICRPWKSKIGGSGWSIPWIQKCVCRPLVGLVLHSQCPMRWHQPATNACQVAGLPWVHQNHPKNVSPKLVQHNFQKSW